LYIILFQEAESERLRLEQEANAARDRLERSKKDNLQVNKKKVKLVLPAYPLFIKTGSKKIF
jgi:hypothetical protein